MSITSSRYYQKFQHIAKFNNYNFVHSYCCRSPDLRPQAHLTLRIGSPETLNYWHWAGVSPYTSSFDLAGTCVFVKQSLSVFCCIPYRTVREGHLPKLHPAILPSSLRIVLPIAFVYSTRPPVSV